MAHPCVAHNVPVARDRPVRQENEVPTKRNSPNGRPRRGESVRGANRGAEEACVLDNDVHDRDFTLLHYSNFPCIATRFAISQRYTVTISKSILAKNDLRNLRV